VGGKGYDSDTFRDVSPDATSGPASHPEQAVVASNIPYCDTLYQQRHKVENMFNSPNGNRDKSPDRPTAGKDIFDFLDGSCIDEAKLDMYINTCMFDSSIPPMRTG
jgi:hypothetical protein